MQCSTLKKTKPFSRLNITTRYPTRIFSGPESLGMWLPCNKTFPFTKFLPGVTEFVVVPRYQHHKFTTPTHTTTVKVGDQSEQLSAFLVFLKQSSTKRTGTADSCPLLTSALTT